MISKSGMNVGLQVLGRIEMSDVRDFRTEAFNAVINPLTACLNADAGLRAFNTSRGELESVVPGAGVLAGDIIRCYRELQDGIQMCGEACTEVFSTVSKVDEDFSRQVRSATEKVEALRVFYKEMSALITPARSSGGMPPLLSNTTSFVNRARGIENNYVEQSLQALVERFFDSLGEPNSRLIGEVMARGELHLTDLEWQMLIRVFVDARMTPEAVVEAYWKGCIAFPTDAFNTMERLSREFSNMMMEEAERLLWSESFTQKEEENLLGLLRRAQLFTFLYEVGTVVFPKHMYFPTDSRTDNWFLQLVREEDQGGEVRRFGSLQYKRSSAFHNFQDFSVSCIRGILHNDGSNMFKSDLADTTERILQGDQNWLSKVLSGMLTTGKLAVGATGALGLPASLALDASKEVASYLFEELRGYRTLSAARQNNIFTHMVMNVNRLGGRVIYVQTPYVRDTLFSRSSSSNQRFVSIGTTFSTQEAMVKTAALEYYFGITAADALYYLSGDDVDRRRELIDFLTSLSTSPRIDFANSLQQMSRGDIIYYIPLSVLEELIISHGGE